LRGSGRLIRHRPNPLRIAKVFAKPKINANKPVTDGYTRPMYASLTRSE